MRAAREILHESRHFQERCSDDDHDGTCNKLAVLFDAAMEQARDEALAAIRDEVRALSTYEGMVPVESLLHVIAALRTLRGGQGQ